MSLYLFNKPSQIMPNPLNTSELQQGLKLLSVNGGRFEINQLLFLDDTAQVADSEEKLCKLVSEFFRVGER